MARGALSKIALVVAVGLGSRRGAAGESAALRLAPGSWS
jgi:hypothetical protein